MTTRNFPSASTPTIAIRAGCDLTYHTDAEVSIILLIRPYADARHIKLSEEFSAGNGVELEPFTDSHGNRLIRTRLVPGPNAYHYDAVFEMPGTADNEELPAASPDPLPQAPPALMRYTLPSRYCESDRLGAFACEKFGRLPRGLAQAEAICDWTHRQIEYRHGSGRPDLSASDVLARGYGVCRDFAHVMLALCRAVDLPARYVAGHMPLIDRAEGDIGVDFHAWCEVWVAGHWYIFDPRYNRQHRGRIKIAHGLDAVDAAFATISGDARLDHFKVWSYQVFLPLPDTAGQDAAQYSIQAAAQNAERGATQDAPRETAADLVCAKTVTVSMPSLIPGADSERNCTSGPSA